MEKKPKVKKIPGAKSTVAKGLSNGGMITARLSTDLHKRFAIACQQQKQPMNTVILSLIQSYLTENETVKIPFSHSECSITSQLPPSANQEQEGLRDALPEG